MNNEDTNMNNEATNKYPIFHDGNVLTSEDLNGSFDFLHKQVKNTRSLLFGQGILNGLTCKYDSTEGAITISPGTALTASGSLIEVPEEKKYEYWVAPNSYPGQELIGGAVDDIVCFLESEDEIEGLNESEKENRRIEKHLDHTNDYLLGLQVVLHEVYKNEKDRICTEQSCSLRGDAVEIKFVPFLMKPNVGKSKSKKFDSVPQLESSSAVGLADYAILPIFLRKAADLYYEKIAAIKVGISAIEKIDFEHLLSEFQWQWFNSLFGEGTGLQTSMNLLDSICFDNSKVNTYLSFVDDVHKAVNEFITFYNDFHSRYQLALDSRLDEAVILGKLVVAEGAVDDAKRYTWTETYRDYNRSKDERILVRLLKRITLLIECFSPAASMADEDVHFTPSSVNAKLGEREIPHYYQSLGDLSEYWDAHNDIHSERQEVSSSSADAFGKADLYRLGFDKLNIYKLEDLRAQAKANNLPVIILKYELEGDDISYCLENYKNESQKSSNSLGGKVVSDLFFSKGIIENADKNKVIDALNELWDYYPAFDVREASQKLSANLRETLIEEIRQSIYLITKENTNITTAEKKALEFVMMSILCHRGKTGLITPNNLPGVDFVGGVEKRDVLLLVTHRDKVLACMNMPYLSLILNEAMFRDQLDEYNKEKKESDLKSIFKPQKVESGENLVQPKEGFDLFMLRYGRNKQHTANYLRERGKMTLRKALDMFENLPVFIFNTKTWEEAFRICFVLNERMKSNVLIAPVETTTTEKSGKLKSFVPKQFDVKVTLFEEETAETAARRLRQLFKNITIEASKDPSEPKTVWMRKLTPQKLSVGQLAKLEMDAVFELIPVSK